MTDPGDSFTTTLTELLVREMAERRQRQAADCQLMADRTAKGLRTLAAPQRAYRDRTGRGDAARRALDLADYLSVPPEEIDFDEDNDNLEIMIEPSGAIKGAWTLIYMMHAPIPALPRRNHVSPPRQPHLCHILHSATRREDCSFVTHRPMHGPGHLQLQRYQPRRLPANRPPGASLPDPEPRFYRLHLAPALIQTQGQRGPQRRTRGGRLGCPSNDVITPLTEHDQRASPSVLPVPAPRASVEPRARERDPQNRRKLGSEEGDTCGPELALGPGTTSGRALAVHAPFVAAQPLAPATAAGRFAQSARGTALTL